MKPTLATATKLSLLITAISLLLADYVPFARITLAGGVILLAGILAFGFSREFAAANPLPNEDL